MPHSGPRSGQPAQEEAPPREPVSRVHRGGYLMLAASGVVLATAFGGMAQFLAPHVPDTDIPAGNRNPGSLVIPADEFPGTMPATSGGETRRTSSSPTTSVTIGPDGQRTAVVPPADPGPGSTASVPQGGGPPPPPTSGSPKPPSTSSRPSQTSSSSTPTSTTNTSPTPTSGSGGGGGTAASS